MCAVLLPPGVNPIAVNKYIISYTIHHINLSGRTMALGSTQPLSKNKYQEYFLRGKGGRCLGIQVPIV